MCPRTVSAKFEWTVRQAVSAGCLSVGVDDQATPNLPLQERGGALDGLRKAYFLGEQVQFFDVEIFGSIVARLPAGQLRGRITLSIPASVMPRSMKGATVAGKSIPPARPHAATTPP